MMNKIVILKPVVSAFCIRRAVFCALFFAAVFSFYPLKAQSRGVPPVRDEFTAYAEINALYHNAFWPELTVRCDLFLKEFSYSVSVADVLFKKAVGTYRLGRYAEAAALLETCADYEGAAYWLGRANYSLGNYRSAIDAFYKAAQQVLSSAAKKHPGASEASAAYKSPEYLDSLMYAVRSFNALGEYASSIPVLEYLLAGNGAQADFFECTVLLFTAYDALEKNEALVAAYKKLNMVAFPDRVAETLSYLAAGAYAATGDTSRALELYTALLPSEDGPLALSSLQKAYALAEPDADRALRLLETARLFLDAHPGSFDEFWLRMGIGAFNSGRYSDMGTYFSRIESSDTFEYAPLVTLYTAQLYALRDRNPKKALETLSAAQDKSGVYAPYFLLDSAKYALQSGNPDGTLRFCAEYGKNPLPELSAAYSYWYSLALFEKRDYAGIVRFLEENGLPSVPQTGRFAAESADTRRIYIQSLALTGRSAEAVTAAEELFSRTKLAADSLLLAQAYLRAGRSEDAYKTASQLPQLPGVPYTAGMAAVNTGRWAEAEKLLSSVKTGEKAPFAQYYTAYSQYRQEKYAVSAASFSAFLRANPAHQLAWNAAVNGAMASLQENRADTALQFAQSAYKTAAASEAKTDSAILLAGVYAETGNYTAAEQTLLPHVKDDTVFGARALFTLADLYSRQKKTAQADRAWMDLYAHPSAGQLSEEALYRRALVYYDGALFEKSAEYFTQYRRTYPKGRFGDAALYFAADSHNRAGNPDFAILYWQDVVSSYPKSSYVFSSLMSLMKAYREKSELTAAINTAEKLLALYGEQARTEGVERQLSQMRLEASGTDRKIAELVTAYERSGADATAQGRLLGLDLAAAYAAREENSPRAVTLLESILGKSSENLVSERLTAARAALQLGTILRSQGKYQNAAAVLLRAAEYYSPLDPESAARSLYGAADAFDRAGADADARLTVSTMRKTWPGSVWTERAAALLGGVQ